ncbi:MAG: hypothetical protein SFY32_15130 [Bacteroidota bacterium]|nr:hypothetical protein [Bacteroidota bacterium]
MLAIKGIYSEGVIKLDTELPFSKEGAKVIVTFLEDIELAENKLKIDEITLASEISLSEDWDSLEDERYDKVFSK